MIKLVAILVCCVGIVAAWILPFLILAIHDVHGHSTMREFEINQLIDENKLAELLERPGYENYSIEQRIRDIGATKVYLAVQSVAITALFLFVAGLVLASVPNPERLAATNRDNQMNDP